MQLTLLNTPSRIAANEHARGSSTGTVNTILCAVGAIFIIGSCFFLLASYKELPRTANPIHNLNGLGKGLGYSIVTIGMIALAIGIFKIHQESKRIEIEDSADSLFEKARHLITSKGYLGLPNPPLGKSRKEIYLDYQNNLVIRKCANHNEAQSRSKKANKLHELLKLQNYDQLKIPRNKIITIENEVFLIEELIPNDNDTLILGMSEYAENSEKYDAAIVQFTRLRCYTGLNDCVGQMEHPLNFLVLGNGGEGIVPRFDNILLYKGQIGVVDSEECLEIYEKPKKERICSVIKENILMFPFHYEKLEKLGEELLAEHGYEVSEEIRTEYADAFEKSLELYDLVYRQNAAFYQQFEIGLDKPLPNRELSNGRREELTAHMITFLQRADQKRSEREVSILKEDLLPKIIEIIWGEIKKFEEKANKKLSDNPRHATIGKLIEAGAFYGSHLTKIEQEVTKNCFQNDLTKGVHIPLRECIQEILQEMCGKEIAYFRQNVSTHLNFYDVLVV